MNFFHGNRAYHIMNGAHLTYPATRTWKNISLYVREGVEKNDKRLESDADKLYNAVIDNSNPYHNMGKVLEQVGVELTTELVVEVLHRLRFQEKTAFRFFRK
jgi:hypothetical protein